jgi:hypothetical protein
MKRNVLLTGLVSALLIAVLLFAACSDGGGSSGLSTPKPGDLPALPSEESGITPVTQDDVAALLTGLKSGVLTLRGQVESLIKQKATTDKWEVKDTTSLPGLSINASGSVAEKSTVDWDNPKAGNYMEKSENYNASINFTDNKSVGGVTVYKGSSIAEEIGYSGRITLKSLAAEKIGVNLNGTMKESYAYGLTVSYNGKSGKIVLEARLTASANKDEEFDPSVFEDFDNFNPYNLLTPKYSGSLQVFGADDKVLYQEDITNASEYAAVLGYFGL